MLAAVDDLEDCEAELVTEALSLMIASVFTHGKDKISNIEIYSRLKMRIIIFPWPLLIGFCIRHCSFFVSPSEPCDCLF